MDASTGAIELSEVAWEQFVGAIQRAERFRRLTATARPKPRRQGQVKRRRGDAARLLWLLAASAAGFMLLR